MAVYTKTTLKTSVSTMLSGVVSDTDLNTILNRAVRDVLGEIDLHSAKRKTVLSPGLFNDIYDYEAPVDLKMDGIIDIQSQVNRNRFDEWRYTTAEEFDRLKEDAQWSEESLCAISETGMVKTIKISKPVNDNSIVIDRLNVVGNWKGYGDGTNLSVDFGNYIKGSASINWDINADGGTVAGIYNDNLKAIDLSKYLTNGSIFVWVYISNPDDITNFIVEIGNDSGNYYYITVTTNNEGTSFVAGWNLLRFDMVDKVESGTVDVDNCTYCAIYMTKDVLKINETDYRFNYLVLKLGEKYQLIYYSKYGWQDKNGAYLENSTADTDYVNADTDEISLIEYKAAELGERHLRNHGEANENFQLFEKKRIEYQLKHPSEAMLMTTDYYHI